MADGGRVVVVQVHVLGGQIGGGAPLEEGVEHLMGVSDGVGAGVGAGVGMGVAITSGRANTAACESATA